MSASSSGSHRLEHESFDDSASLGAMGSVIQKLDKLLQTEDWKSIIKVKFKKDVESIFDRLKELSEVYDPPITVNYWMKDVREISYDMADFFNGLANAHDAEAKVDEISEFEALVEDAIERYDSYDLEKSLNNNSNAAVRQRLGSVFASETELVGMEDRIKELRSLVETKSSEDPQLKVVSILGVDQGVGKSTLAQSLWRELEAEFGTCRAFVLMSRKPDMRMILGSILSQVRPHEPPGDYRVPVLIHDIRTHLQDKRYFVVIDDLWAISAWDIIRRAFPEGQNHSRIIVTTTVEDVAHTCSSDRSKIVDIKPLRDEQTCGIFLSRVFGPGKLGSHEQAVYKFVSDEITKRCGGLPLAVICIGTLVCSQQIIKQTPDVLKLEQQHSFSEATVEQKLNYVRNFLDERLTSGRPTSSVEILNIVQKLCYSSLPHWLKTCLLYLSMYPENYLIQKEDLVKQWIAEGFIVVVQGQSSAEIAAGSYFDVLVGLGLIQRMDTCLSRRRRQHQLHYSSSVSYVVHPMVFEFVTRQSMEDNFITIIDYSQSKAVLNERIHRLSLHFGSATYAATPASIRLSHVRSLAFMGLLNCLPSLVEFSAVRVMILHVRSDDGDREKRSFSLREICKLLLLRYLQVRSNVTVELPDQMQPLKCLQTLEIDAQVSAVPADTVDIPALKHVRIGQRTKHKSLASHGPPPDTCSTTKPPILQVLELLPPICSFSRLPATFGHLTNLRVLEVVVRELWKYDLDLLGGLGVLTVLSLYVRKPYTERRTFHPSTTFPALEYFKLVTGVLQLSFPENAMPKLRRLKICFNARGGDKYSLVLHGIHHLKNLQEVAARIGIADGAEERDREAAESAFNDAIIIQELERRRMRSSSLIIRCDLKRVDKVDEEEYDPPPKSSNKQGEITEEMQNIDPPKSSNKQGEITEEMQNIDSSEQDDKLHHEVWRRSAGPSSVMPPRLFPSIVNVRAKLQVLLEEQILPYGVRCNINNILRAELSSMLYGDDHLVRLCDEGESSCLYRRYLELICDIDDWVDQVDLSIHIITGGGARSLFSNVSKLFRHSLFSNVSKLFRLAMGKSPASSSHFLPNSEKLGEITDRVVGGLHSISLPMYERDRYAAPKLAEPQEVMLHRRIADGLVGYERPMEKVMKMLASDSYLFTILGNKRDVDKLKIISIVGMVGSGKTTLAETVYQVLKGDFDICAFVSVGQHRSGQMTLEEDILRQVEMKDQESMGIRNLKHLLENKRYLIVVDDLWNMGVWEDIKHSLPWDNNHARIVITTTDDALASYCASNSSDCIYKTGLLSDAESQQLFLNQVFGTGHDCPQNLEKICAPILRKCGGLPLAIVRAAVLARGQPVDEWRTIGLSLLSDPDTNNLWQKLNCTYNHLPLCLKACMLYLSMFPQDYEVEVERIVRLWMAEGLIAEETASSRITEETAISYLDGLISKNLVLPLHVNHLGIPKYCTLHPVIHDFIVDKSREVNFVSVLNDQHQQDVTNSHGTIRRLSVQRSSKQDQNVSQDSSMDLSHVRSIIVMGPANTVPHLTDLELVRVLDLEGCKGMVVCLSDLSKLPLLRYLSLRGTDVSELPGTIGELRFLQTLDVRFTNVKELPLSIVNLQKLMHLLCGSAMLPPRISKIKVLRTLSCAIVTDSFSGIKGLSELKDLVNLELFCDFTRMPWDGRQLIFRHHVFQSLKKLCIRCNSASVTFKPGALPSVQELELSFEGILTEESLAVSGIEYLRRLKHVLIEFAQHDAGAMATVDAVRKAVGTFGHNHPEVTVRSSLEQRKSKRILNN